MAKRSIFPHGKIKRLTKQDVISDGEINRADDDISATGVGSASESDTSTSGNDGDGIIDPASVGGTSSTGNATGDGSGRSGKRRGRPAGSKNGTRGKRNTNSETFAKTIADLLYGIHSMGAVILKTPEVELEKEEAEKLGQAIQMVSDQYDIPIIDPKTMAWINLGMVGGMIYGPRALLIIAKQKERTINGPQIVTK